MSYFVTGATGFIGRHLVANLLKRKGTVYVLVRKDSQKKLEAIGERMGWDMARVQSGAHRRHDQAQARPQPRRS
jgi:thioester reductase-like protein